MITTKRKFFAVPTKAWTAFPGNGYCRGGRQLHACVETFDSRNIMLIPHGTAKVDKSMAAVVFTCV